MMMHVSTGGPSATLRPESVTRYLLVAAQVLLVVLVIRAFKVEDAFGFVSVAPLIFVGFLVHSWLPRSLRLPFFVALTFAAVLTVFGWKYGGALIVIGLGLIALCHLPVPYAWRVALVVLAGGGLALARNGWLPTPGSISSVVIPIIGAMFMFRLVIYLYDLRNERGDVSVWQRVGYFFLLPNICFPLFPVVDYQAFRRNWYDRPALEIYQKGALWMVRGVTHIILYRVIYQHFLPAPVDVAGLGGVVQYVVATYGLYLRISGQFHLVVGILCLFGFNLPETHHLYYLATSFTDYWRRINIYWKDFMTKVFYFPSMMRFKHLGMRPALVLSTAVVFTATWLLHSYQWYWLRGTFPITLTDVVFWGILGAFVVVASLREASAPRKKRAVREGWSLRAALSLSVRTVGMFTLMCVLWSLWSSPTIGQWWSVVSRAGESPLSSWGALLLGLASLVVVGVVVQYVQRRGWSVLVVGSQPAFRPSAAYATTLAAALLVLGTPALRGGGGTTADGFLASVLGDQLNAQDLAKMQRGYYEDLLEAPRLTAALDRVRNQEPPGWGRLWEAGHQRERDDLMGFDLFPNADGVFKEATFRTNRWGMRDRDYSLQKPPGTLRIAAVGASHEMGSGVEEEQVFLSLLEDDLNAQRPLSFEHYEVLNFSVAGFSLLQRREMILHRTLDFEPNIAMLAMHNADSEARLLALWVNERFIELVHEPGRERLAALVDRLDLRPDMQREDLQARLLDHMTEFLDWYFEDLGRQLRAAGVLPVVAYVPETQEIPDAEGSRTMLAAAERAGWVTVNIYDAYQGAVTSEIQLRPWDFHPNVVAHRLLADRLYEAFVGQVSGPILNQAARPDEGVAEAQHSTGDSR